MLFTRTATEYDKRSNIQRHTCSLYVSPNGYFYRKTFERERPSLGAQYFPD